MSHRYFLKIDGIPGLSTHPRHQSAIEIRSISLRNDLPSAVGAENGGARESRVRDLRVVKKSDPTSSILMHASGEGRLFRNATLTIERSSVVGVGVTTAVIRMESVMVRAVLPRQTYEEITLNFSSIHFEQGGPHAIPPSSHGGASGWWGIWRA